MRNLRGARRRSKLVLQVLRPWAGLARPPRRAVQRTLLLSAPALTNVRHSQRNFLTSAISSLDKCSHALILEAFFALKSP